MSNELNPGAGGPASPPPSDDRAVPPGPDLPAKPEPKIGSQLEALGAKFDQLQSAELKLAATKQSIADMMKLGDTVTSADVVKSAAGLVAAGIPAVEVATTLADMPEGSSAIQAWVQQHDQDVQQNEQKLQQAMSGIRYQLGVASLRSIVAHSAEDHFTKRAATAVPKAIPTMNPLEPSHAG